MNYLQSVLPLLSQMLLMLVLISMIIGRWINVSRIRFAVIAALLLLGLLAPVNGLSVSQWLRSVVGDLSVLTLVVFLDVLTRRLLGSSLLKFSSRNYLLRGIALTGAVFYPLALGLTAYDPYQLGYAPILLGTLLVCFSLLAWFRSMRDLAVVLLLPLLAYNLHLLESANLWEYLLDPVLLSYALVQGVFTIKFIRFKSDGSRT